MQATEEVHAAAVAALGNDNIVTRNNQILENSVLKVHKKGSRRCVNAHIIFKKFYKQTWTLE
jgi:hypothetical protein